MNGRSNEERELAREESGAWTPVRRTIVRPDGRPNFLRRSRLERPAGSPGSAEPSSQENLGPMSIETPVSLDETEESETGMVPPIPLQALASLPINRLPNPFGKLSIKSKLEAMKAELARRAAEAAAAQQTTGRRPAWLRRKPRASWFERIRQRQQANLIPQAQQQAMPVSWQTMTHPDRESWEHRGVPPTFAPVAVAYPSPFTTSAPATGTMSAPYAAQIRSTMQQMGLGAGNRITIMQTGSLVSKLENTIPRAAEIVTDYLAANGITQMGANIQLSGCGFAAKRNPDGTVTVKARLQKSSERGDTADYTLVVPPAEVKKAMRFMQAWHKQQHAGTPADPTAPIAPAEPEIGVPAAPAEPEPEMAIVGAGLSVRKAYAKLRATPEAGRAGVLSQIINDLLPSPLKTNQ